MAEKQSPRTSDAYLQLKDIPEDASPKDVFLKMLQSLRVLETLDTEDRQDILSIIPNIPLQTTTDAGSVNTIAKSEVVRGSFRVKYWLVFTNVLTLFYIRQGSRKDGPYVAAVGVNKIELPHVILGGNEIDIEGVSAASATVTALAVGTYVP